MAVDMVDGAAGDRSDQERIQALVAQGKITQEEASRLMAALQDTESGNVEPVESKPETNPTADSAPERKQKPLHKTIRDAAHAEVVRAMRTEGKVSSEASESWAGVSTWANVAMSAGSLQVSVDTELTEPFLESEGQGVSTLDRTKNGWDVFVRGKTDGGWERGSFSATLRIPAGCGVALAGKAGTVVLNGVPYLKGDMKAGTLKATDLSGFDLDMSAGTLHLSARLAEGEHRLDMRAGTAVVTLLPGSSVQVEGDVRVGSLKLPASFTKNKQIAGADFSGKVGEGEATLNLSERAGTLELRCE